MSCHVSYSICIECVGLILLHVTSSEGLLANELPLGVNERSPLRTPLILRTHRSCTTASVGILQRKQLGLSGGTLHSSTGIANINTSWCICFHPHFESCIISPLMFLLHKQCHQRRCYSCRIEVYAVSVVTITIIVISSL